MTGSAAHWGVVGALEPVVVNGLQKASDSPLKRLNFRKMVGCPILNELQHLSTLCGSADPKYFFEKAVFL